MKKAPVTDWTLVTAASESEALARLNQLLTYAALTIVAVGIAAALVSTGVVNHLLGGLVRIRDRALDHSGLTQLQKYRKLKSRKVA